ncbi:MerR family transcriptional regulator [Microbulbifer sp. JTAC008]|uniref:MerR family transcriptional regulator n=1 Tax=unclassified Microbulbifer TaxID=2619833 RepID=UPI00403A5006
MFIGEVSKRANLTVKAIRFYEEKGLIAPPKRQGRYRVYTAEDVEILTLISEAKTLGVTLAELKDVIRYNNGEVDWARISIFLKKVKRKIEAELESLSNKADKVDQCIASIDSCHKSLDPPLKGRR